MWLTARDGEGTRDLSVLTDADWLIAAVLAAVLIAAHFVSPAIARLDARLQDRVASLGGGIAVAYLLVKQKPEKAEGGSTRSYNANSHLSPTTLV